MKLGPLLGRTLGRILGRLLGRGAPVLAAASVRDARALAVLHAASFHRGWSDGEFEALLRDRNVVADRATVGARLVGFILSRIAADEAEILSVAVASARRGKGLARQLLDLNLRRLAGLGARTVFLEVDEANTPARRLYRRAGFREVGRREGYYPAGERTVPHGAAALASEAGGQRGNSTRARAGPSPEAGSSARAALILRRDLA